MIGLFDSGVGGLYALRELRRLLPNADLAYFADEANLPYGPRDAATLLRLCARATRVLLEAGAGAILAACGTVSSTVYPRLAHECPVPIFDAITPLVAAAAAFLPARAHPHYLLLATEGTVKAGVVTSALTTAKGASVTALATPAFVGLSERIGEVSEDLALGTVRATLAPLAGRHFDAVLLGCTHFSPLSPHVWQVLGAPILDGATLAARAVGENLPEKVKAGRGGVRLFTSGSPRTFARAAARILGQELPVVGIS